MKTALHANGTNLEGDWDAVFAAIKRCHEVVHELGAPRITTVIKLGTRTDRPQAMEDKVASVLRQMATRPDDGRRKGESAPPASAEGPTTIIRPPPRPKRSPRT